MPIKVAEIFNSIQGEGYHAGTPSIFIRTFGCNFQCAGFGMPLGEKSTERFDIDPAKYIKYEELPLVTTGCDSYPSWDPRFKNFSPLIEIPGIVDRVEELLPSKKFGKDQHLILTGGEPLLGWQKQYPLLLEEIYKRGLALTDLTFETNGTQFLDEGLITYLNVMSKFSLTTTFSVSAKLPCSGQKWEEAILPDRILQYQSIKKAIVYLKFVVSTSQDVEDAQKAVGQYRKAGFNGPVYLMPVGGVDTVYNLNAKNVAELAMKNGYRYSPRLQVDLWKNLWNT